MKSFRNLLGHFLLVGIVLLLMTLNRWGLYICFRPEHSQILPSELQEAFWMGFRFDLSLISYFATLSIILTFFLQPFKHLTRVLLVFWFLTISFLATLFAIDYGFYSYFQDHINLLFFGLLTDDTWALIKTFWSNYPFVRILLVYFISLTFLWHALKWLTPKIFHQQAFSRHQLLVFFTSFLAFGLAARGSVRIFPLNSQDSIISQDSFMNFLTFNAGHSFAKATKLFFAQDKVWNPNAKLYQYSSEDEAVKDFLVSSGWPVPAGRPLKVQDLIRETPNQVPLEGAHVVVIVMESFGSYWIRFSNQAEFDLLGSLQPHLKSDTLFLNSLPNAGSTIGTLSSFLIGFPQRQVGSFITETELLNAEFPSSIARPFVRRGYQTRFIYGSSPAWRDIGKFAKRQGFQQVDGQIEIQKKLSPLRGRALEKHDWGLFDEDVFEYARILLQEASSPQLLIIMTTTNHPPYSLPETSRLQTPRAQLVVPDPLKIPCQRPIPITQLEQEPKQTYMFDLNDSGLICPII